MNEINDRVPKFCKFSWTVKRHIVVKKSKSKKTDWLATAWKSLCDVNFKGFHC